MPVIVALCFADWVASCSDGGGFFLLSELQWGAQRKFHTVVLPALKTFVIRLKLKFSVLLAELQCEAVLLCFPKNKNNLTILVLL